MNEKYVTSFRIIMAGIYTYLGAGILAILWEKYGHSYYNLDLFAHAHDLGYVGIALIVIGVAYGIKSLYELRKEKN